MTKQVRAREESGVQVLGMRLFEMLIQLLDVQVRGSRDIN